MNEVIILSRKLKDNSEQTKKLEDIAGRKDWILSITYADDKAIKGTFEFLLKEHLKSINKQNNGEH